MSSDPNAADPFAIPPPAVWTGGPLPATDAAVRLFGHVLCGSLGLFLHVREYAGRMPAASASWALDGFRSRVGEQLGPMASGPYGEPAPAVERVRAVSAGPPDGWPGASAVDAAIALVQTALLWTEPRGPGGADWEHTVRAAVATVRDDERFIRVGLPAPTKEAVAGLSGAVQRELARAVTARTSAGADVADEPDDRPTPVFDAAGRVFRVGGFVKAFRMSATNQMDILSAFQQRGWVRAVNNPVLLRAGRAVRDLNNSLGNQCPIRFGCRANLIEWERRTDG